MVKKSYYGKKTFLQRLWINKFIEDLKKIEKVSHIKLSERRKSQIEPCSSTEIELYYSQIKWARQTNRRLKSYKKLQILKSKTGSDIWTVT